MARNGKSEKPFPNPNYRLTDTDNTEAIDEKAAIHSLEASEAIYKRIISAERDSLTDSLTGAYNRGYYEKFKNEKFDPARDLVGLVFVDLNDLKETNDEIGHEAGDELIKNTAQLLRDSFRKVDDVVRMGGDEFVVICRSELEDDSRPTEAELQDIINTRLEEAARARNISLASGLAVFDPNKDRSLDDTLVRADKLMYKNKTAQKDGYLSIKSASE